MGDDSCSKGHGFESRHQILDGHFFKLICCKKLYCLFEKTENKRKRVRSWPIFKKLHLGAYQVSWNCPIRECHMRATYAENTFTTFNSLRNGNSGYFLPLCLTYPNKWKIQIRISSAKWSKKLSESQRNQNWSWQNFWSFDRKDCSAAKRSGVLDQLTMSRAGYWWTGQCKQLNAGPFEEASEIKYPSWSWCHKYISQKNHYKSLK